MKSSRYTTWLLSGLCALATMSCSNKKDDLEPLTVSVSYVQTMCADQWGPAEGEQQLVAAAQAYLSQQNVTLYQPRATTGPGAAGMSCNTPTGRILEGSVSQADLPAVLALGFTKR
jgi:hypothetical protein